TSPLPDTNLTSALAIAAPDGSSTTPLTLCPPVCSCALGSSDSVLPPALPAGAFDCAAIGWTAPAKRSAESPSKTRRGRTPGWRHHSLRDKSAPEEKRT